MAVAVWKGWEIAVSSRYPLLRLGHSLHNGDGNFVHQVINLSLELLQHVGRDEEVGVVQVLDDELGSQGELLVQMQQELEDLMVSQVTNLPAS
jgi:hypothetical protein